MEKENTKPALLEGAVMPRFYYRITNALKIGFWALKNPEIMQESNFKMLSDLLGLIMKVQKENRPIMTHIAFVHPEIENGKEQQIVSIWAGAGVGAEPNKRIAELLNENSILKSQLSKRVFP